MREFKQLTQLYYNANGNARVRTHETYFESMHIQINDCDAHNELFQVDFVIWIWHYIKMLLKNRCALAWMRYLMSMLFKMQNFFYQIMLDRLRSNTFSYQASTFWLGSGCASAHTHIKSIGDLWSKLRVKLRKIERICIIFFPHIIYCNNDRKRDVHMTNRNARKLYNNIIGLWNSIVSVLCTLIWVQFIRC